MKGSSTPPPLVDQCDGAQVCRPLQSATDPFSLTAEQLPGRKLPIPQTMVVETITPQDIYDTFEAACGRCHKGEPRNSNGNWSLNGPEDAANDSHLKKEALTRLLSTDPKQVMPPTRGAGGVVLPLGADDQALVTILQQWTDKGLDPSGYTETVAATPYFTYPESDPDTLRESFTNLGSCVPEPALVGCAQGQMQKLDTMFSKVHSFADLPTRLEQTDISTLDSAVLAQRGVISYAPTYTLFSDGAKKMRYVRVPLGQKIHYDATKNDLVIPPNTRFYKTFMRGVIDRTGQHAYRKIETRLILSRPDTVAADGTVTRNTIFASYRWSLDESRAELVQDLYRDRTPFRDLALRTVIDEPRAIKNGFDPDTEEGIDGALNADDHLRTFSPTAELDNSILLTRGYALPGRDRCIQCHMGSSSQSYILGFNPYQVDRRTAGQGGIFDDPPAGASSYKPGSAELSQLQRLVSYGIIDGVPAPPAADPTDGSQTIFKLEESQLPTKPRNEYELKAQAYMMGNCAFCHNPRGFPSVQNPSLKTVLDFLPFSVEDQKGGIFHFDLDKMSPRTSRTDSYNVSFPYITPSMFERQAADTDQAEKSLTVPQKGSDSLTGYVVAPWRSLLFRNTQTPFTYSSDAAIHPHMPLNVAGYDQRVPHIMGDWMLSIPAKLKAGAENSDKFTGTGGSDMPQPWQEVTEDDPHYADYVRVATLRRQAFENVGVTTYEDFKKGCPDSISHDCEDSITTPHAYVGGASFHPDASDVFAPEMRGANPAEAPEDIDFKLVFGNAGMKVTRSASQVTVPAEQADAGTDPPVILEGLTTDDLQLPTSGWSDLIPDRPDWLLRDLTIPPGAWVPRRANWADAFKSEDAFLPAYPDLSNVAPGAQGAIEAGINARRAFADVVYTPLMQFHFSDKLRAFATTEQPYGLWKQPDSGKTADGEEQRCDSLLGSGAKPTVVSDLAGNPPQWVLQDQLDTRGGDAKRPVYMELPGESMFNLICINCHGKDADANSLLANTILELTGGNTRVADLRDGLFGNQGDNRKEVFPGPFTSEETDTMAVRYLLWMGLGGTEAVIPQVVLNRVGATRPLGVDRIVNPNIQPTPNMLSNAVSFCQDSIGLGLSFDDKKLGPGTPEFDNSRGDTSRESPLVASNGDAELWLQLCAMDNPPPVRVIEFLPINIKSPDQPRFIVNAAYWRDAGGTSVIPPDARFGDQHGNVAQGIADSNVFPWCFRTSAQAQRALQSDVPATYLTYQADLEAIWHKLPGRAQEAPPMCPDQLFVTTGSGPVVQLQPTDAPVPLQVLQVAPLNLDDRRRDVWATRGAMNVGASVFLYLDGVSKGVPRKPAFDACALPAQK